MENRLVKIISVLIVIFIIGLVSVIFLGIGKSTTFQARSIVTAQETRFLMDTTVEIRAVGTKGKAESAIEEAFQEIERVESLLSRYISTSDVSKINLHAGEWTTVSEETLELIEQALDYSQLSHGSFDFTVGQLVTLWGFGTNQYRVPTAAEIEKAVATVNYEQVEIDWENLSVRIPAESIIDLGGIAKGYAVDRAADVLRANNISSGLINAGGDILAIGVKPDGSSWRVGVQDPRMSTAILTVLPLQDMSIVTSGDYQRFFQEEGVRYHHILNPSTGYPAADLTSVTVVAESATVADALSTAVFILGAELGLALIEELDQVEVIIVDQSDNVTLSSGLQGKIQVLK